MTKRTITLEGGTQVHISQESYDELAEAIQNKRWKPEMEGMFYWYISDAGIASRNDWEPDQVDYFRYSQRNVFRTKAEAEKHLEYLKALAVLRDDAEDWEPDWSNEAQEKHCVFYNHSSKQLERMHVEVCQYGDIYFETREKAQHSIDTHEKEWLTVFGAKELSDE